MVGTFQTGIDTLLTVECDRLKGRRIGLVTHPAALTCSGTSTDTAIRSLSNDATLAALFAPEHGIHGALAAGEHVDDARHPLWNIPIHSLYGQTRRPTTSMLSGLDLILVDLQHISIRPYTYGSTLRYLLEAAAAQRIPVIVADRPDPLANVVDGPLLDPPYESFVGAIPGAAFAYGLTLGELALFLKSAQKLHLELHVARMKDYHRDCLRRNDWQPWVSPSPSIRTWETAIHYPSTVLFEALPMVDHGRSTPLPFQVLGTPSLDPEALIHELNRQGPLPGLALHPHVYAPTAGRYAGQPLRAIRLTLSHLQPYRPFECAIRLMAAFQTVLGADALWNDSATRPEFFDQLCGTANIRTALQCGTPAADMIAAWQDSLERFRCLRAGHLLYQTP